MAKQKVISSTYQLEKKRKSLKRGIGASGFFAWFIPFLLGGGYVGLAIAGKGSYLLPFNNQVVQWKTPSWLSWASKIPYFDECKTISLFDFSSTTTIYRLIIAIAIILVPIILAIVVSCVKRSKANKKYAKAYNDTLNLLANETNGLTYRHLNPKTSKVNFANGLLRSLEKDNATVLEMLTMEEQNKYLDSCQYQFTYKGKQRHGLLMQLSLNKIKTSGLLQFRSYGKFSMSEYEGQPIKKLGFAEGDQVYNFICYTSLGEEVYKVVDGFITKAIALLHKYVPCGIVITLEKSDLYVFFDGFKLNLARPLKQKLPTNLLEKQARAINTLFDKVMNLAKAFCQDSEDGMFIKPRPVEEETPVVETKTAEAHTDGESIAIDEIKEIPTEKVEAGETLQVEEPIVSETEPVIA